MLCINNLMCVDQQPFTQCFLLPHEHNPTMWVYPPQSLTCPHAQMCTGCLASLRPKQKAILLPNPLELNERHLFLKNKYLTYLSSWILSLIKTFSDNKDIILCLANTVASVIYLLTIPQLHLPPPYPPSGLTQ